MKTVTYKGIPFATPDNLYRVRDDDPPRQHESIQCPPQVNPLRERPLEAASTIRTPMSKNGWEGYLRALNGEKFDQAVAPGLAMFNNKDRETWEDGNDKMESLLFGRNWLFALPTEIWNWKLVMTLNYMAGPPPGMPSYEENPIFVQKFTWICRKGAVGSRNLFYPVVARVPVFIQAERLEPYARLMETQPPPESNFVVDFFRRLGIFYA